MQGKVAKDLYDFEDEAKSALKKLINEARAEQDLSWLDALESNTKSDKAKKRIEQARINVMNGGRAVFKEGKDI